MSDTLSPADVDENFDDKRRQQDLAKRRVRQASGTVAHFVKTHTQHQGSTQFSKTMRHPLDEDQDAQALGDAFWVVAHTAPEDYFKNIRISPQAFAMVHVEIETIAHQQNPGRPYYVPLDDLLMIQPLHEA